MSDDSRAWKDQYMLRLPDGMRERLKTAAAGNKRSMNAEIVDRLDRSFYEDTEDNFLAKLSNSEFLVDMLPPGLAGRIQFAAEERHRSVQEEVVQALEAAFPPPPRTFGDYIAELRTILASNQMSETLRPIFETFLQAYEDQAKADPSWTSKAPARPVKPGSFPTNLTPAETLRRREAPEE